MDRKLFKYSVLVHQISATDVQPQKIADAHKYDDLWEWFQRLLEILEPFKSEGNTYYLKESDWNNLLPSYLTYNQTYLPDSTFIVSFVTTEVDLTQYHYNDPNVSISDMIDHYQDNNNSNPYLGDISKIVRSNF